MKQIKKALCLLLVCCLLTTTACKAKSKRNAENQGIGRYTETDITPPINGQFHSAVMQDGTIICADYGLKRLCESRDGGESWEISDGPGAGNGKYEGVRVCAFCPDGSFIVYIPADGLYKITRDGNAVQYTAQGFDAQQDEGSFTNISILKTFGEDRLLLCYMGGAMMVQEGSGNQGRPRTAGGGPISSTPGGTQDDTVIKQDTDKTDEGENESEHRSGSQEYSMSMAGPGTGKNLLLELSTGKLIAEIPLDVVVSAAADGDILYLLDMSGEVFRYGLNDGASLGGTAISFASANQDGPSGMAVMLGAGALAAADGSLYSARGGNLLEADTAGETRIAINGTDYAFGAPRSEVDSVFILRDGSILINVSVAMQSNHLYKYIWDEDAKTDPDKTITVWSLSDNALVRAAIAEFRKQYPDALVVYEVALSDDSGISVDDAVKTLNTRLLGGNGPDILILDGCPKESYVKKGILLDLSELVDTGGIFSNLLAPFIQNGSTFLIPTQFYLPALIGEKDALSKVHTLEALAALVKEGNGTAANEPGMGRISELPKDERAELYFDNLEELFDVLWPACEPAIINNNHIEEDALRAFLTAARTISDKYGLCEDDDQSGRPVMGMGFAEAGGPVTILTSSLVHYTMQQTNFGAFLVGNFSLLRMMMERTDSDIMPFPGLAEGVFQPSTVAGLNADTHNVQLASEFIAAMLSAEVQQFNYGTGLPVTKNGLKAQIADVESRNMENGSTVNINTDDLISKLTVPSDGDKALLDMMWDSIVKYMKDETDLEGAVKSIESSVKNYLAERQ